MVLDGETGMLVPPGDSDALAAAIGALLEDSAKRQKMAAAAAADGRRRFGHTDHVNSYLGAYAAATRTIEPGLQDKTA